MRIDDSTEVLEVLLRDLKTGGEVSLTEREGTDQHHWKTEFGNYHIQLRLDWKDWKQKGKNGEPTLDADIWTEDKSGGKHFLKHGTWHHTERELDTDTGLSVYKFKFQNLEWTLQPKKKMTKTITVDMVVVKDSLSIKKNDEEVFNSDS